MSNNKILLVGAVVTLAVGAYLFWPGNERNIVEDPADSGKIEVVMYKNEGCDCCTKWAFHMERKNFVVEEKAIDGMMALKQQYGVPARFESCHTAIVGDYFVEGHVPVEDVERLLSEKPDALGLTVPGMPIGSPGMEGPNPQTYDVYLVGKDGSTSVYATH